MGITHHDAVDVQTLYIQSTAVTASAAELNILDGVTASAAELNLLDGSVAGTAVVGKAAVLGANKNLDELHLAALYLGAGAGVQVSATAAELNRLAGSQAGTAVASKALVLDANKSVNEIGIGGLLHMGGTVAPDSGDHVVGEIVWNSAPTAGGTLGWVCVAAGTPGTWKAIGTIEA